jgi:hypothetical protein
MKMNHRHTATLLSVLALCLAAPAFAQHAELAAIYEGDQAARSEPAAIDWNTLAVEDRARRERVMQLLRAGEVGAAVDYYHAAMVYQHGQGLEDIRLAHALATVAMSLDPDEAKYRWLVAASWDRIMTTQLQPQWYGTQFQSTPDGMFLYPVADGAVSDQDRRAMQVPTLDESRGRVAEMARMNGLEVDPTPPTIEQLRDARRVPDRAP